MNANRYRVRIDGHLAAFRECGGEAWAAAEGDVEVVLYRDGGLRVGNHSDEVSEVVLLYDGRAAERRVVRPGEVYHWLAFVPEVTTTRYVSTGAVAPGLTRPSR